VVAFEISGLRDGESSSGGWGFGGSGASGGVADDGGRARLYGSMASYPKQLEVLPLSQPFDATGDCAVRVPGSKSLTNRALLLAALSDGQCELQNVLFADDTKRMLEALESLGFKLEIDEANTTVKVYGQNGNIPAKSADLFLGNAGTATRFLTAACCLGDPDATFEIRGIPRMHERPIGELVTMLRQLGARIEYLGNEGFPPLRIHGGLKEKLAELGETPTLNVKPTLSSQYISAMLQIAPLLPHGLEMEFDGPITSRPYVEMTAGLQHKFGAKVVLDLPDVLQQLDHIAVSNSQYELAKFLIEPDASNATYFFAAATVVKKSSASVGLDTQSTQGDVSFASKLGEMGAEYTKVIKGPFPSIQISSSDGCISQGDHDLGNMPDTAQTLAVVALFADGPTTMRNIGTLRVKETDRVAALENELSKLGATVEVNGDDMTITPPVENWKPEREDRVVVIETYDDHRMAMSFAIAGLASDLLPGQPRVVIDDPGCVAKTYPQYWDHLHEYLGAEVVAH